MVHMLAHTHLHTLGTSRYACRYTSRYTEVSTCRCTNALTYTDMLLHAQGRADCTLSYWARRYRAR